jgi:hypothetical protein
VNERQDLDSVWRHFIEESVSLYEELSYSRLREFGDDATSLAEDIE